jgi:hypothetical protein
MRLNFALSSVRLVAALGLVEVVVRVRALLVNERPIPRMVAGPSGLRCECPTAPFRP